MMKAPTPTSPCRMISWPGSKRCSTAAFAMASSERESRSSNQLNLRRKSVLVGTRGMVAAAPILRTVSGFRVEVAHDIAACALTVPLQEEVWSGDVIVPPQLMLAVVHNGGFVALGYIDGDDRPAGFVFGFLGIYDYHFRHHSHMLAVRERHRGTGLARALKEAQRDHCLDQGIEVVAWTMDPLEARNAHFNFGKLGAFTRTYHRDFYGAMPDKLNAGLPSDRVYVEWPIGHDRTYKRLRGEDRPPALADAEREGIAYLLRAERERPAAAGRPKRETHQTRVICRAQAEGIAGWGESVAPEQPWYSGETPKTVWYALEEYIVPQLFRADLKTPEDTRRELGWIREHRMAKATIETAIWDLFAKREAKPLSAMLGGARARILCVVAIGIQPSLQALFETLAREIESQYH